MKAIAELAFIGLIGTTTIMLGIITPPLIIKSTLHQQTDFTLQFEKIEHTLISFLSSGMGGTDVYELLGRMFLRESISQTPAMKLKLDYLLGTGYCLTVGEIGGLPTGRLVMPPGIIESLGSKCESIDTVFTTAFVLPYNKGELVKLLRIGVE